MKDPVYETSSGALEALLETGDFIEAFHYTYTLTDGTVLRYSAYDADIAYSGHSWQATAPAHSVPDSMSWHSGLDVDTLTYQVFPRVSDPLSGALFPDLLEGIPWGQAARVGVLDGAVVELLAAYAGAPPTTVQGFGTLQPTGVLRHFRGRVAAVDEMHTALSVNVNDYRELLNLDFPPNLYGPSCRHILFDAGCQLVASVYRKSGTVSGATSRSVFSSAVTAPSGFSTFAQGRVVFTSGQNAGFARGVRSWSGGAFQLIAPLPFEPAAGDAFDAYPGCDKTYATCSGAGNQVNFGGQRFIPPPEIAV